MPSMGNQPTRHKLCAHHRRAAREGAHLPPLSAFRFPLSRGLTLVELLIVMTILVLLVGTAIPVLSPATDERRMREASRGVNTFIAGAKARAVQTGRPFGVMLKKLSEETGRDEDNGVCLELYYVAEPSPYAGFSETSRVQIAYAAPTLRTVVLRFVSRGANTPGLTPGWTSDLIPPGVFRPGDIVEVGGVGYRLDPTAPLGGLRLQLLTPSDETGFYETQAGAGVQVAAVPVDGAAPAVLPVFDRNGQRLASLANLNNAEFPYWSEPLAYQIRRLPTLTSAPPYQLPTGAAIDLRGSGTDAAFFHRVDRDDEQQAFNFSVDDDLTSNRAPVIVMFSPDGSVSQVYATLDPMSEQDDIDSNEADEAISRSLTGNLYLLIGRRENVPAPTVAEEADFESFAGTNGELEEAKAKINWLNGESRWVVVGGQTGAVATAPNSFVNPVSVAANAANLSDRRDTEVRLARELASQQVKEGGR